MSTKHSRTRRAGLILPMLIAACALTMLSMSVPRSAWAAGSSCRGATVAEVKGMACPFCAYGLRKHLLAVPGVKGVQVDLNKSQATIDPKDGVAASDARIQQAINDAGFSAGQIRCADK